eukprot:CAMPEP_0175163538 /NCGR_PEP_ID=MMETSP0087-20121206/25829_1 /TAXON_ID=136419 /ORGANISM="Unknown Unknown, Strain D1" /LENGTH=197 /DNA_ID=CAMNT_0016452301 /DNA_START=29 /DNA_END=619 /DNA_ORIENTATION=+
MNENLPPNVMMRLMKEIRTMCKSPPEGISLQFDDEDITTITATIEGPVGTPFEGGSFVCKLLLGQDFPRVPPKGVMTTKIFHPNVSKKGEICVNTLKKDWSATHGLQHILTVIRCLLIHPNPESALNEDAGKMLIDSYEEYAERAKLMTQIHAKSKGASKSTEKSSSSDRKGPEKSSESKDTGVGKKTKAVGKTKEI